MYGLDDGAVLRLGPWLHVLLRQNLVPDAIHDDAQGIVDEASALKAEQARRAARFANGDANARRSPTQTERPSEASASCVVSVDSLARQATVTPAAVTHFLRQWEERTGCRLPRSGRRWGPIPAGVADEFLAQSRKGTR